MTMPTDPTMTEREIDLEAVAREVKAAAVKAYGDRHSKSLLGPLGGHYSSFSEGWDAALRSLPATAEIAAAEARARAAERADVVRYLSGRAHLFSGSGAAVYIERGEHLSPAPPALPRED